MQVCLLWCLLQKLSIVLFCRVDTFKETSQLVRNVFQLLQRYMVCEFQAIREIHFFFDYLFLIDWKIFGTIPIYDERSLQS